MVNYMKKITSFVYKAAKSYCKAVANAYDDGYYMYGSKY